MADASSTRGGPIDVPSVRVLGTRIDLTSYQELFDLLDTAPTGDRARTVAFCNVHSVMTARRDRDLGHALARFDVATPDGMPLVWTARALGHEGQNRVYGPDFMELALDRSRGRRWRHYLYGGSEVTLYRLTDRVRTVTPGVDVVGATSPPFRSLTPEEEKAHVDAISASGATHIWVGLGMPKQELFIDRMAPMLAGRTLLGVGAAFDFLAGTVPQAPDWMQDRGLEWAHRLAQEPRRLLGRYVVNNPAFVLLATMQVLRHRLSRRGSGTQVR